MYQNIFVRFNALFLKFVLASLIVFVAACDSDGPSSQSANEARLMVAVEVNVSAPSAGTVSGQGYYQPGEQVILAAVPNTGYRFSKWTVADTEVATESTYSFTALEDRTLVARFETLTYDIRVEANTVAGGSVTGGGSYDYASTITLTATPNTGYSFVNWTRPASGNADADTALSTNSSYSFSATEDRVLVANFALRTHQIVATSNTAQAGSILGSGLYGHGASVNLSAIPNTGYNFVSWTVGGAVVSTIGSYTFSAIEDTTLLANFSLRRYDITATSSAADAGSVTGVGSYDHGASVTLTAVPATGYRFVNWMRGNSEVSASSSYSFSAEKNLTLLANFALSTHNIIAASNLPEAGVVSGAGVYGHGASVILTAMPNPDYHFINWTVGGAIVSTSSQYTFTATEDSNLLASFVENTHSVTASIHGVEGGSIIGTGSYDHGASATLTATPNAGYSFINWTAGGVVVTTSSSYTFEVKEDQNLVANFAALTHSISATSNTSEGGAVIGTGQYDHGSQVTLTATANSGYSFVNWTRDGNVVSTEPVYRFIANEDSSYLANFAVSTTGPGSDQPVSVSWYKPSMTDTWQWQLSGELNTNYNATLYDIDLFDAASKIAELKASGKKVICYFSAGTSEDWRLDFANFQPADMGNIVDDWEGERWLDIRSENVKAIMQKRLDLARSEGCDGVEPDNMDAYDNDSGFGITSEQQLVYNRYIADQAHLRGLAVGLKNSVAQVEALVDYFDFAVNEQCFQLNECESYKAFTGQNKPVFNAEYPEEDITLSELPNQLLLCQQAQAAGIHTLILPVELDGTFRISCD